MSIYSGFPTRRDESNYNSLLSKLLETLQSHVLELINTSNICQGKVMSYRRVLSKMKQLQEHKYLPPKLSEVMSPLCHVLGLNFMKQQSHKQHQEFDNNSRMKSEQKKSLKSISKYRVKTKIDKVQISRYADSVKGKKSSIKKVDSQRKHQSSFHEFHEKKLDKMNERFHKRIKQHNRSQKQMPFHESEIINFHTQTNQKHKLSHQYRQNIKDKSSAYDLVSSLQEAKNELIKKRQKETLKNSKKFNSSESQKK